MKPIAARPHGVQGAGALLLAAAVPVLAGTAAGASDVLVQREAYVMGTRLRMIVSDQSREAGLARLDRALGEIEAADAELSTWRTDSRLTALNAAPAGEAWQADASFCRVLKDIWSWQRATDGTFDPAIGRLLDVWGVHGRGRRPTGGELASARERSGLDRIQFDPERCRVIRKTDAVIDAGAFGKGEALDRAARAIGDGTWMIDFGGQVSVLGHPVDAEAWQVAIAHPLDRERPLLAVRMTSGSLSTSGGSERDVRAGGLRVGHILDPRTGEPASFDGSVTVWHARALAADALSTALYVMGPDRGLPWAEARGLSVGYLVPDAGGAVRVLTTPAFRTAVLSSDQ